MAKDSVITLADIPVLYVAGDPARSIGEQAPKAFAALEATMATLRGRHFYGAVIDGTYRACVARHADDPDPPPHPTWVLPGGRYLRHRFPDWQANLAQIGPSFMTLTQRPDFDATRPCIEHYRRRDELLLLVPLRG